MNKPEATFKDKVIMERSINAFNLYVRLFWESAYHEGYSAGYAARDKLSCVNCGDGGNPVEK